jgi:hypothetical protein
MTLICGAFDAIRRKVINEEIKSIHAIEMW